MLGTLTVHGPLDTLAEIAAELQQRYPDGISVSTTPHACPGEMSPAPRPWSPSSLPTRASPSRSSPPATGAPPTTSSARRSPPTSTAPRGPADPPDPQAPGPRCPPPRGGQPPAPLLQPHPRNPGHTRRAADGRRPCPDLPGSTRAPLTPAVVCRRAAAAAAALRIPCRPRVRLATLGDACCCSGRK